MVAMAIVAVKVAATVVVLVVGEKASVAVAVWVVTYLQWQ